MESNAEPEEETVNDPGKGESRSIEVRLSAIWWAAGVLVVAIAIGFCAYAYCKSTGEDLDAARTQGTETGQRKGAARGAAQGYAAGFKKGREDGFERTYPKAYRKSYAEAFEEAGLEVPAPQDIPVSSP
jgi:flagellar biosynthesis/type III secretory pathway protein FliH